MSGSTTETRWPNYCPFCGSHARIGGTGSRHGTPYCANCYADYDVRYFGAYPASKQLICDDEYGKHGGDLRTSAPPPSS